MNALDLCFRHRSSLVLALVAPILIWTLIAPLPTLVEVAVGAGFLLLGVGLRFAAMRCLGKGARVHKAGAREGLVDWGPYAWSRNPLYVAAALIVVGLGFMAGGGPWALLLLPGTFLVYTPVVMHEERAIREQEGGVFVDYLNRVPRWLGFARGPEGEVERGEPYPWNKVLSREIGLVPGLTVGALAILGAKYVGGPWLARWELPAPAVVGGVLALLALGAVVNSVLIQRKRIRRDARRALLHAAEAEQAAEVQG
ncbi:MAG: isoprenylcysteine carboxylmethyltransferase family protein [Planctomycetota bacterium]